MDTRLAAFLESTDTSDERACLEHLVHTVAEPIIRRTVASRLAGKWDDIDDVISEARLELLLHLHRTKANADATQIGDFAAYVATMARNTCHQYFRRRRPGQARLKKQIRFLLQEPEFQIWEARGATFCGLAGWRENSRGSIRGPLECRWEGTRDLAELVRLILESAGGPVALEAIVSIVAETWRIPVDHIEAGVDVESLPAASRDAELSIDRRRYVERLWQEIHALPLPQRVALLLNLRDGRGNSILSLFPLSGIASFAETAAALEMSEIQLSEVWLELPWDDLTIGRFLGCTRQKVINLRMSAKKRLSNRLGHLP